MANEPPILLDGFGSFEKGINSGEPALLLPKNQLSFAINVTVRGSYATHRPAYRKSNPRFPDTTVQSGVEHAQFQGACYYQPDAAPQALLAQIGGRLFQFTPDGATRDIDVLEVTIPGDPNPAAPQQAWLWQSEKWVIVQDGNSVPVFYDGTSSRRSDSTQVQLGVVDGVGFIVPAVGAVATITLAVPYTGQIGQIFFIDGKSYQAAYTPAAPNATVTELYDAVASHAIGEQVVINPNIYGVQAVVYNVGSSPGTYAVGTLNLSLHLTQPSSYPNGTDIIVLGKIFRQIATGGNFALVENRQTITIAPTDVILAGQFYQLSGTAYPITVLGTVAAVFAPPGIGNPVDIELSTPYTGTNGEIVYINNAAQYTIAQKASPPPGLTLYAININDTPGGPSHANKPLLSVPELPPGRMGCYGLGRNWLCLTNARTFMGSDIVGGTSGTPANNFRDSVLKSTENTYLAGGGVFVVPGTVGDIQAMIFTATLDTSLGQGPLQVFTPNIVFSVNSPVKRTDWSTIDNPILTQSLISNGALAQNSTVQANNDTLYRAIDGLRSLILARRQFATWGNVPISHEVQRVIDQDDPAFLQFGSASIFSNRLLMTSKPTQSAFGVFNRGLIALDFNPISSMGDKAPSVYDGLWTGINVLQVIHGRFGSVDRCFAFTYNNTVGRIEIYELLSDGSATADDNGLAQIPITWQLETPCGFREVKGKGLFDLVRLMDGELYVADVADRVTFEVFYRPQFDPCWHEWHSFSICAEQNAELARRQNRVTLGLGRPPANACDPANNRPYFISETFQFKVKITGHCLFYGMLVKGSVEPRPALSKVVCDDQECRLVQCALDPDYDVYELQDLPIPEPPIVFNDVVYYSAGCAEDQTLTYDGTLPSWITIDAENNRLVGAANTYQAATQAQANNFAQAALNQFAATAIGDDLLTCSGAISGPDWNSLVWGAPTVTPSTPIPGSSSVSSLNNTFHIAFAYPVAPGSSTSGQVLDWGASLAYTGPAANCNINLLVAGLNPDQIFGAFYVLNISSDVGGVALQVVIAPGAGTIDYPFSFPDCSGGANITITIQMIGTSSSNPAGTNLTWDGTLTNVP